MTSMRPAIVICVPRACTLWMTHVGTSSPTSLNGTHVRLLIDTPQTSQTGVTHRSIVARSASSLARIDAMNPARILAPGFLTQRRPDLVRVYSRGQRVMRGRSQRGEIQVGNVRAAEGRPEGRLDRLVKLRVLHASGNQRDGHDLIGHCVRNNRAIDDRHALGDLAQDKPQRDTQGRRDGLKQFGGCLLLAALNLGQVAEGDLRLLRDFAQGTTLALANAAQDIAQFAAQQRGFAQCLFHSVTVAVLF